MCIWYTALSQFRLERLVLFWASSSFSTLKRWPNTAICHSYMSVSCLSTNIIIDFSFSLGNRNCLEDQSQVRTGLQSKRHCDN